MKNQYIYNDINSSVYFTDSIELLMEKDFSTIFNAYLSQKKNFSFQEYYEFWKINHLNNLSNIMLNTCFNEEEIKEMQYILYSVLLKFLVQENISIDIKIVVLYTLLMQYLIQMNNYQTKIPLNLNILRCLKSISKLEKSNQFKQTLSFMFNKNCFQFCILAGKQQITLNSKGSPFFSNNKNQVEEIKQLHRQNEINYQTEIENQINKMDYEILQYKGQKDLVCKICNEGQQILLVDEQKDKLTSCINIIQQPIEDIPKELAYRFKNIK